MSRLLEEELAEVLTESAGDAPAVDPGFLAGVQRRQGRRQRRRAAVLALGAVVALTAGSVLAVRVVGMSTHRKADRSAEPAAGHPDSWDGRVPDFAAAKSPQQLWPSAVRRVPSKLPDGVKYAVAAVLGEEQYLVEPLNRPGKPVTAPEVFDTRAKTTRTLGDPNAYPASANVNVESVTVVGDRVIWTVVPINPSGSLDIWSAKLDGTGAPTRIAQLDRMKVDPRVRITVDAMFYQASDTDDIKNTQRRLYRLPIGGGQAQAIEGSAEFNLTGLAPYAERAVAHSDRERRTGQLWNLVTGARVNSTYPPKADFSECDPVLCMGRSTSQRLFVSRLDGTGFQEIPGKDNQMLASAIGGRFGVGTLTLPAGATYVIWDRFAGVAAGITGLGSDPQQLSKEDRVIPSADHSLVLWPDGAGGSYLVNLAQVK